MAARLSGRSKRQVIRVMTQLESCSRFRDDVPEQSSKHRNTLNAPQLVSLTSSLPGHVHILLVFHDGWKLCAFGL